MIAKNHIISALPFGAAYYFVEGDILLALLAAFSSIVIDIDHCLDYYISQKRIDPLRKMLDSFNTFEIVTKNYFIFHSWELIILFGVTLFFYRSPFLIAVFTGYTFHLLLDQIFNTFFLGKYKLRSLFYFFLYRKRHNFEVLPLRQEGASIRPDEKIFS